MPEAVERAAEGALRRRTRSRHRRRFRRKGDQGNALTEESQPDPTRR